MSTPTVNKSHSSLPSVGFKGSDLPPLVTDDPPRVLIAGAGLGGLFLGIFLERAGIPYEIFERTSEIRPLGTWHEVIIITPKLGVYSHNEAKGATNY